MVPKSLFTSFLLLFEAVLAFIFMFWLFYGICQKFYLEFSFLFIREGLFLIRSLFTSADCLSVEIQFLLI